MEIKSLEGPSRFLEVMGDSPRNRILDFLLGEKKKAKISQEISI